MLFEVLGLAETESTGVLNNEQVYASLLSVNWENSVYSQSFFLVLISEPAGGERLVKMTVMRKGEGGAIINQCRYLESLV